VRILTVSHFFEHHGGGIERVAAQLTREFLRAGHRAIWTACDVGGIEDEFTRIPLKCFDPAEKTTGLPLPVLGLDAVRSLSLAVRECDAVVIHDSLYFTSIAALIMAKLRHKPVVLIQHIADIQFKSRAKRFLMRLANLGVTRPMIAAADHLIFISDEVRRKLVGDPPRRRYLLLYNGVDSSIFFPRTPASRTLARSRFGIPSRGKVVLFVGRFVEKKGLTILKIVAARRLDLQFVVVGSGPVSPEAWDLPNVRVFAPQSPQDLAELYGAVDLLILPSVGEGFPLVVQEAMACGVPVICGRDSAAADPLAAQWLRGIEIQLADELGSADRCDAAITQSLETPIDKVTMARYAAQSYSWNLMAEKIVGSLGGQT
jgi:alpha-maltose-1-phosphate synthase